MVCTCYTINHWWAALEEQKEESVYRLGGYLRSWDRWGWRLLSFFSFSLHLEKNITSEGHWRGASVHELLKKHNWRSKCHLYQGQWVNEWVWKKCMQAEKRATNHTRQKEEVNVTINQFIQHFSFITSRWSLLSSLHLHTSSAVEKPLQGSTGSSKGQVIVKVFVWVCERERERRKMLPDTRARSRFASTGTVIAYLILQCVYICTKMKKKKRNKNR